MLSEWPYNKNVKIFPLEIFKKKSWKRKFLKLQLSRSLKAVLVWLIFFNQNYFSSNIFSDLFKQIIILIKRSHGRHFLYEKKQTPSLLCKSLFEGYFLCGYFMVNPKSLLSCIHSANKIPRRQLLSASLKSFQQTNLAVNLHCGSVPYKTLMKFLFSSFSSGSLK